MTIVRFTNIPQPVIKAILIFALALSVRIGLHLAYTPPLTSDAREYFINSQSLTNEARHFSYDHWYQRTPAYVLYLHLTQQSMIIQILLSALTCVLLEILYRHAGLVFAFYLPSIAFSNLYMKETLLVFLFVLAVVLLRNHKIWLILVLPIIFAGFVSYGSVIDYNSQLAQASARSVSDKLFVLWRPEWNYLFLVERPPYWFTWILRGSFYVFYIPVMFLFIRKVRLMDFEVWLALGITVIAILGLANERYREPVMPFVIGFVVPHALESIRNIKSHLSTLGHPSHEFPVP